jgi:hypothetical protein
METHPHSTHPEENMDSQNNKLVIREYPVAFWLIGLVMISIGVFYLFNVNEQVWGAAIWSGIGLLLLLLSNILTITADRITRTLTIQHSGLLSRKSREVQVAEIAAIQVESSRSTSSSSRSSSPTYRIVVITKGSETIPFTNSFSSGASSKENKARRLREFLGVGGQDMSLGGIFKMATGMAQEAFQEKQEALTGSNAEEHITDGVHWNVQTAAFGGSGITRWFSPDLQCPGGFVYLAQKVQGQGAGMGGLLGGLNKMLYQQTLGLYGFGADDTPGLAGADLLPAFDAGLDSHFGVFTGDPAAARQVLNPWAVAPLVDWGTRYPLKQVQKPGLFGQLVVLFSPRGTYVACMGTLIPEAVEEITNLGVALVKAK